MGWLSFDCEKLVEQEEKDLDINVQSSSKGSHSKHKDPRRTIEIIKEQKQLSKELREYFE